MKILFYSIIFFAGLTSSNTFAKTLTITDLGKLEGYEITNSGYYLPDSGTGYYVTVTDGEIMGHGENIDSGNFHFTNIDNGNYITNTDGLRIGFVDAVGIIPIYSDRSMDMDDGGHLGIDDFLNANGRIVGLLLNGPSISYSPSPVISYDAYAQTIAYDTEISAVPDVPEPSTLWLSIIGLVGMFCTSHRRNKT